MSDPRHDDTAPATARPCVLLVGCSEAFAGRCRESVAAMNPLVKEADVESATRLAGRFRPLAIVMIESVFDFDALGFRALARNAGADLLVLPSEDVDAAELESQLLSAIVDASRRRALETAPR